MQKNVYRFPVRWIQKTRGQWSAGLLFSATAAKTSCDIDFWLFAGDRFLFVTYRSIESIASRYRVMDSTSSCISVQLHTWHKNQSPARGANDWLCTYMIRSSLSSPAIHPWSRIQASGYFGMPLAVSAFHLYSTGTNLCTSRYDQTGYTKIGGISQKRNPPYKP